MRIVRCVARPKERDSPGAVHPAARDGPVERSPPCASGQSAGQPPQQSTAAPTGPPPASRPVYREPAYLVCDGLPTISGRSRSCASSRAAPPPWPRSGVAVADVLREPRTAWRDAQGRHSWHGPSAAPVRPTVRGSIPAAAGPCLRSPSITVAGQHQVARRRWLVIRRLLGGVSVFATRLTSDPRRFREALPLFAAQQTFGLP